MKDIKLYIPQSAVLKIREYHTLKAYVDACISEATRWNISYRSLFFASMMKRGQYTRVLVDSKYDNPEHLRLSVADYDSGYKGLYIDNYICAGVTELALVSVIDCLLNWDLVVNGMCMMDDIRGDILGQILSECERGAKWSYRD